MDPSVQRIMRQMTALWGLHILRVYGDQGYMEGFLSPKQLKDIEKEYLEVSKYWFCMLALTQLYRYSFAKAWDTKSSALQMDLGCLISF